MHVGIFAERFIGRYGADRVCVILAEGLRRAGHRVTLVGVRFSPGVCERFGADLVRVPEFPFHRAEARTVRWMRDSQYYLDRNLPPFDACVVTGFPFVSSIPHLREHSPRVLFLDFGVVPTQGFGRPLVRVLEQLKANRRRHLPQTTGVVAISEFIAASQSRPEAGPGVPVHPILLGADHNEHGAGVTEEGGPDEHRPDTLAILEKVRLRKSKLVLLLGRWEPGCYKNSQAAFDVIRSVKDLEPSVGLLVLSPPFSVPVPPDLYRDVFCLGYPTDAEMAEIVRQVDAGISVSRWEGFNLPVAEVQLHGKHVFAFDLAAHPEVVASPDQLCRDAEEMGVKLAAALAAGGTPDWARDGSLDGWRRRFTWRRFLDEFGGALEAVA